MNMISRVWGRIASVLAAVLLVLAFIREIWSVLKGIDMFPDLILLTFGIISATVAAYLSTKARQNRRTITLDVVKRLSFELPRYPTPEDAACFVVEQLKRIGVKAEVPPPRWYLSHRSFADSRSNSGGHLNDPPT